MKFRIDQKIFEKFPSTIVGMIIGKEVNNRGTFEEAERELRHIEKTIREKYTAETLSQNPKIDVWRKTYAAFGAKPKEHKSSVENLYRLVLRGDSLRHINKLVDCYNLISLKHMLPVGGEDLDVLQGVIELTLAGPHEAPVLLLGDKEPRHPHEGEVIYKDGISVICRRWNWREADRTKFTEQTRNCILVIEGLLPVTKQEIEHATMELKDLVQRYCGGNLVAHILDRNASEIAW